MPTDRAGMPETYAAVPRSGCADEGRGPSALGRGPQVPPHRLAPATAAEVLMKKATAAAGRTAAASLPDTLRSITPKRARQRLSSIRADADRTPAMAADSQGRGSADRQLLFPSGCQPLA